MATNKEQDLIPRVSLLEQAQAAISKDLSELSNSVQRQGEQLTSAITQLAHTQNANYNALSEKIGVSTQTDWQSLLTGITVLFIILGAILVPVWISFSYEHRLDEMTRERISALELKIDEKYDR